MVQVIVTIQNGNKSNLLNDAISMTLNNPNQAVSEEMRYEQTDRQTDRQRDK